MCTLKLEYFIGLEFLKFTYLTKCYVMFLTFWKDKIIKALEGFELLTQDS